MSSQKIQHRATHAHVSPCIYEVDEARHIPTRNYKNKPVGVKSGLDSNFKSFSDTAIRQNFNPKPEIRMEKNSIQ